MTSQEEETPVISGGDDQFEDKAGSSGPIEGVSNGGDTGGENPVIEEGNDEPDGGGAPVEIPQEVEEDEREGESEERETTAEQPSSEELPPYFSEVYN